MWDMKKEVREEVAPAAVATKIIPVKNLNEAVMVVTDHALDSIYGCETDQEKIELIIELMEEFFQIWINEDTAEYLLNLARKCHVVDIEEME